MLSPINIRLIERIKNQLDMLDQVETVRGAAGQTPTGNSLLQLREAEPARVGERARFSGTARDGWTVSARGVGSLGRHAQNRRGRPFDAVHRRDPGAAGTRP